MERKLRHQKKYPPKKQNQQLDTQYESDQETHSLWSVTMLSTQYKPKNLLGRVFQKQQIHKFIKGCLLQQINNKVLYISGVPGVGKTATTKQIISNFQKGLNPKKISFHQINAMNLKNSKDIYKSMILKVKPSIQSKSSKSEVLALQMDVFLRKTDRNIFFLIDQIDFLYTKDQSVLYNLFQWAYNAKGSLSLIVIANTMDFPQRLSPKLMSRMGNHRLVFKPYNYLQVSEIVQDRLQGSNIFEPKALQYAAKKLSAYTSDIRKIFTVLKQAVSKNKTQKIQTAEIQKIWSQFAIQANQEWRKDLGPLYLKTIQIIKRLGGKAHSGKIYQQTKAKKMDISCIQLQIILQQLHDMGIIKINEKKENGYIGFNTILLKL